MWSLILTTWSLVWRRRGAEFGIEIVAVGDDGVEAVVAAVHLDDDEDVVLAGLGGQRGAGDELRDDGTQRQAARRP